jgi:nucleoside-diphosphate-sugar epimerase
VIVRPVVIFGEHNRGNVYQLLKQIVSGKFLMVGDGYNKKSMAYVHNVSGFLAQFLDYPPGVHVFNYADKPDMSVEQLIRTARQTMGIKSGSSLKIPYSLGLLGGYFFDGLSKLTGKAYPISSIRIKKFAAETTVSAKKSRDAGFVPPYSLEDGLRRMIETEFGTRHKDVNVEKEDQFAADTRR